VGLKTAFCKLKHLWFENDSIFNCCHHKLNVTPVTAEQITNDSNFQSIKMKTTLYNDKKNVPGTCDQHKSYKH